jgi:hypothetical protein
MMFGKKPEDAANSPMLELLGAGFSQSLEMIAAQRFTWQATVNGSAVATARVNWLMGEQNLSPSWTFGPEGERFEVSVEGEPSLTLAFHGMHPQDYRHGRDNNPGLTATAMHCVNFVPAVCGAPAGLLSILDLPIVTGRAATGH